MGWERPFVPNDKGARITIRAFVTLNSGLIWEINEHTLNFVKSNQVGTGWELLALIKRQLLMSSQAIKYASIPCILWSWGNKEGYWNYNWIVLLWRFYLTHQKWCALSLTLYFCLITPVAGHFMQRLDEINVNKMNKAISSTGIGWKREWVSWTIPK